MRDFLCNCTLEYVFTGVQKQNWQSQRSHWECRASGELSYWWWYRTFYAHWRRRYWDKNSNLREGSQSSGDVFFSQREALEAPLFTHHIHLMHQIVFLNSYGFQLDENSFGRASLCISLHNTPQCKQTEAAARRLLCLTMVVIKKPHLDFVRTKSEQHPFKLQHPLKLEVKFQKYF